ncbi:MAG: NAD-dependent epimerase/dehydratase family protein [Acidimicrobiales bacterium]
MRVVVLGGTKFIGRAAVEELHRREHDVVVVHRGEHEPDPWIGVEHLHRDRDALSPADVAAFDPDVVVDAYAMSRRDAERGVRVVPAATRCVVLSSMDVYEAYGQLLSGRASQAVPLAENAPLRSSRFPYRGRYDGREDYEKLDVEEVYRSRGAVVCRLPAVFGPHDDQRREAFILRRVRAGRDRIPFGPGTWLWSRLHVHDAACGIVAAVEHTKVEDEVLNIGPQTTLTVRQWAKAILSASGSEATLVTVRDAVLPGDLWLSGAIGQHILADSSKARSLLGWRDREPVEAVADSVRWHLSQGFETGSDWTEDDAALASSAT